MATIVLGAGRKAGRRRRINPREGVVRKPGEGFLVAAVICLIGAAMLAFLIIPLVAMGSNRTVREVVDSLISGKEGVPVRTGPGDALREAVRVVDACPSIRPVARRMTVDRTFGRDELVALKEAAANAGCVAH